VLFNGNFPVANPRFQSRAREAAMLVERFGWTESQVDAWQATQDRSLVELSRLAATTGVKHPDASIVYRPHPFEGAGPYGELLGHAPNVHLIQSGSVDGWILRSSAVVQRSCTTAIEAVLAGVPAVSPRWVPSAVEMTAAEAVSIPCESPEDFDAVVTGALRGEDVTPSATRAALDDVVRDWFHRVDGRAHERVGTVVLESVRPHARREEHVARCRFIGTRRRRVSPRVMAKRFLPPEIRRLSPDAGTRARGAAKVFRHDDVSTLVRLLGEAGGPTVVAVRPHYATWLPFGRSVAVAQP
jgi:hypothetical protein